MGFDCIVFNWQCLGGCTFTIIRFDTLYKFVIFYWLGYDTYYGCFYHYY
jgi:hypothetical protein